MKQLYPLVTAFLFCSNLLVAQPRHPIIWQKCFGGFNDDAAKDAVIFADETAVIVGSTNSTDGDVTGYHQNDNYNKDGWVVKIDTDGNIIWQKAVGGTGSDVLLFVKARPNNSSYCIGYSSSADGDVPAVIGDNKLWLIKLDSSGNTMWSKVYDSLFVPSDAVLLSDGSLAVIANAVVKINPQGDLIWKKIPDGSFGNTITEYSQNTIVSSAGYGFNIESGEFEILSLGFASLPFSIIKSRGGYLLFSYKKNEENLYCFNGDGIVPGSDFVQYLIKATGTTGDYIEEEWHRDYCPDGGRYGSGATYTSSPNGLLILTDTSFVTVGNNETIYEWYQSSAFFYHNGIFSKYGYNIAQFNSVKSYAGDRSFLCVGYSGGDDADFKGNHRPGSLDMLVVKLAALSSSSWTGLISNDWNDKDNWSNHEVPYMGTIVTIPAGTPNNPVVNNDAACYSIKLEPGATINVNDGIKLQITGRKIVF